MIQKITRNDMRKIFQPSRLVLAITFDYINERYNFLPIAFNMYCGYNPLSFSFALHDINYSYRLFDKCEDFCIAIPGENLAEVTLESGKVSGQNVDKFKLFGLHPLWSHESPCPGIEEAIMNIYCKKRAFVSVSDHAIIVGEVHAVYQDTTNQFENLLSVAPNSKGYLHLAQSGIHTIAIAKQ